MAKRKNLSFLLKQFFLLVLCVCLTIGLCSQPVKSTVSYITSLSATCVNTFTGEEIKPNPPSPGPDDPDTPSTGDNSHLEWYIFGMLISLAGFVITLRLGCKKESDT